MRNIYDSDFDAFLIYKLTDATWRSEVGKLTGSASGVKNLNDLIRSRGELGTSLRCFFEARERAYMLWQQAKAK